MIARARYHFIALHRTWFPDLVVAELRGYQDDQEASPFWEAVGRHFYQMSFAEADLLNGRTGSQIIHELGPQDPIHVSLLPKDAQDAIGQPHRDGRRALELLLEEGFENPGYVDIFDAGPTVIAEIDRLQALRQGTYAKISKIEENGSGTDCLVATGQGHAFRAARGRIRADEDGVIIAPDLARALNVEPGSTLYHAPF